MNTQVKAHVYCIWQPWVSSHSIYLIMRHLWGKCHVAMETNLASQLPPIGPSPQLNPLPAHVLAGDKLAPRCSSFPQPSGERLLHQHLMQEAWNSNMLITHGLAQWLIHFIAHHSLHHLYSRANVCMSGSGLSKHVIPCTCRDYSFFKCFVWKGYCLFAEFLKFFSVLSSKRTLQII